MSRNWEDERSKQLYITAMDSGMTQDRQAAIKELGKD